MNSICSRVLDYLFVSNENNLLVLNKHVLPGRIAFFNDKADGKIDALLEREKVYNKQFDAVILNSSRSQKTL